VSSGIKAIYPHAIQCNQLKEDVVERLAPTFWSVATTTGRTVKNDTSQIQEYSTYSSSLDSRLSNVLRLILLRRVNPLTGLRENRKVTLDMIAVLRKYLLNGVSAESACNDFARFYSTKYYSNFKFWHHVACRHEGKTINYVYSILQCVMSPCTCTCDLRTL
jgi:hypothetical protein